MKLKNLLQGRLGRAKYFFMILSIIVIFSLVSLVYGNIFGAPGGEMFAFYIIFILAVVILTIRRLHDLNLRGWLAPLIPILFAISAGISLAFYFSPATPFFVEFIIWFMFGLIIVAFSLLFLWKGTSGSNRFGEAPLR